MDKTKTISLRLPVNLADKLDSEVRRRRMVSGDDVSRAAVVREILEKHLANR